ncbi:hypothetical protein [Agitococcus lubricus]|uniref:Lipoprotein n=1 Tax=Agitococcus lubricus TaxID=1077255 RepID=A0A2T5IZE4_9GAMM|nr:hypothetical protein [Agitococcus lubricus]PTQ89380.1 hypothetical protein C8N29_107113 [Agitococcus lubricus]
MRFLIFLCLALGLVACNSNHDAANDSQSQVSTPASVDPFGDLSPTVAAALDLPPAEGKLSADLLPPQ